MHSLRDETYYFKTEKNPGPLSMKLSEKKKKMQFDGYDIQKEHAHPSRLFL